jgi:N-acetylglutamate synthase-like GNAT family acetyltransferase
MAISSLDPVMAAHFGEEAAGAAELLNAFVGKAYMGGKGVGAALLKAACELALKSGARNLVVNSGPRYFSNWGFYDRLFEKDCGIILNKYGEGRHAKTWIKRLA